MLIQIYNIYSGFFFVLYVYHSKFRKNLFFVFLSPNLFTYIFFFISFCLSCSFAFLVFYVIFLLLCLSCHFVFTSFCLSYNFAFLVFYVIFCYSVFLAILSLRHSVSLTTLSFFCHSVSFSSFCRTSSFLFFFHF